MRPRVWVLAAGNGTEARTLVELTGWSLETIQQRMPPPEVPEPARWWQGLWK